VFFCNVVHHIDGRPAYYAKIRRALKPGGRVVVIDFQKTSRMGPAAELKIARDAMEAEWTAAGFTLSAEHRFLPEQYFLEFRPR